MDLPQNLTFSYDPTSNGTLETGDMLPSDAKDAADSGSFALGVKFWDNGVATSFYDYPAVQGQDGNGWVSIETVLVRLNNSYAPRATFPVWGDSLVINGTESKIGYDAAVCVEVFEPIVGKTSTIHANFGDAESQGRKVGNFQDDSVHTGLNSSGLFDVFRTLHGNSVNIMLKDNGRDAFYVPNPSLISFTSGHGWNDYTSLDANLFAKAKASADASNLLPYFAGSAQVAARRYEDVENASVHLNLIPLMILIASVWIMGTIAGLFVPRLPMKVPRRGFQLYSWLAAFIGGEIEVLAAQDGKNIARSKYMSLTDMEKEFGKVRVKYNFAADGAMEKV
ncbi:hypothetical protein VKT23_002626 [Stygiomarasmius scandens]|uniref:Lectin n=1 Tax=Marasmiellus scandens TaxID=2682957 RepID=A0ABR1K3U9_9AGAR